MFKVFKAPRTNPTTTTLLATRESWEEVEEHFKQHKRSGYALMIHQALSVNKASTSVRLSVPNATAEDILRDLGLSA